MLVEQGPSPNLVIDPTDKPKVRISVLDVSEMPSEEQEAVPPGVIPIAVNCHIKLGLLDLQVGVSDKAQAVNGLVDNTKQELSAGLPYRLDEDDLPRGLEGQPLREKLDNELPQILSHGMTEAVWKTLTATTERYYLMRADNAFVRRRIDLGR